MKNLVLLGFAVLLAGTGAAMAAGDPVAGKAKTAACAACHNADGNATIAVNPKLAGQHAAYLAKQIRNFISGERVDNMMMSMVSNLSEQDIDDIAAYYSQQKPAPAAVASEEKLDLGEAIYRGGITSVGVAACIACHGPGGNGNPAAGYPMLSGQNAAYTVKTLGAFRNGTRANDANSVMRALAKRMTDEEIQAVSNYIQGLN